MLGSRVNGFLCVESLEIHVGPTPTSSWSYRYGTSHVWSRPSLILRLPLGLTSSRSSHGRSDQGFLDYQRGVSRSQLHLSACSPIRRRTSMMRHRSERHCADDEIDDDAHGIEVEDEEDEVEGKRCRLPLQGKPGPSVECQQLGTSLRLSPKTTSDSSQFITLLIRENGTAYRSLRNCSVHSIKRILLRRLRMTLPRSPPELSSE